MTPSADGSISSSQANAPWRACWSATAPSADSSPATSKAHGMQVDHDLPQRADRAADAGPRAVEMLAALLEPQQRLVEGEQVLQRAVVQHRGDLAARALLGVERLGHEPPARRSLLGDLLLGAQPRHRAVEHVRHRLQERHVLGPDRARLHGVGGQRAVRGAGSPITTLAPLRTPAAASTAGWRKRSSRAQSSTTTGSPVSSV